MLPFVYLLVSLLFHPQNALIKLVLLLSLIFIWRSWIREVKSAAWRYNDITAQLWQRPHPPQNLRYLLSGLLQKKVCWPPLRRKFLLIQREWKWHPYLTPTESILGRLKYKMFKTFYKRMLLWPWCREWFHG